MTDERRYARAGVAVIRRPRDNDDIERREGAGSAQPFPKRDNATMRQKGEGGKARKIKKGKDGLTGSFHGVVGGAGSCGRARSPGRMSGERELSVSRFRGTIPRGEEFAEGGVIGRGRRPRSSAPGIKRLGLLWLWLELCEFGIMSCERCWCC